MTTQSLPDHIARPHIRPVQPIPVKKEDQQLVALRDPLMLTKQTMIVAPAVVRVIQAFQGTMTIDKIAEQIKTPVEQLTQLAEALDKVGLLWGPTFEKFEAEWKDKLAAEGAFPKIASESLGEDEATSRAAIKSWFDQTEDPELESEPIGIVAPHIDYERGWPNYAGAYYALQNMDKPDRVVILGTNHFGLGDGVVLSQYGFDTPLGRCPADQKVIDQLSEKLGKGLTIDQLDHLAEHSIELQLPWVQYCWGDVPVVAALLPDPTADVPDIDDEEGTPRVGNEAFIDALRETLEAAGGKTFFIASSDLSHVGPQFGEPRPVDDQRRFDVERHDREMLGKFIEGDADEFISAFKWSKNPTRWCSVGNMAAVLQIAQPKELEMIDYRQASDEQGNVMVSSAAIAMY